MKTNIGWHYAAIAADYFEIIATEYSATQIIKQDRIATTFDEDFAERLVYNLRGEE